jgi:hypothetical protein
MQRRQVIFLQVPPWPMQTLVNKGYTLHTVQYIEENLKSFPLGFTIPMDSSISFDAILYVLGTQTTWVGRFASNWPLK